MLTFKVDKSLSSVGANSDGSTRIINTSDSEREELEKDLEASTVENKSKEELDTFNKTEVETGDTIAISNIKNALDTANRALAEIERLKTDHLNQAREAADGPEYTARDDELTTLGLTYRTEINRVINTATYNGKSLILNGQTYEYDSSNPEIHTATSTGGLTIAQLNSNRNNITSATIAESFETLRSQELKTIRIARAGYGASENKASDFVPEKSSPVFELKDESPDAIESAENAKMLAKDVAEQIGSAYADEEETSKLIDVSSSGLDPARVKALLS